MNMYKKFSLYLLLFIFVIISIKPFLFTINFFLYMTSEGDAGSGSSKRYIIRALHNSPQAYRTLIDKERVDLLLLSAIIYEDPTMISVLNDKESKYVQNKHSNDLYYCKLMGKLRDGLVFGEGNSVSRYLLLNKKYNYITESIILEVNKHSYEEYFLGICEFLISKGNNDLKEFIENMYSKKVNENKNKDIK